MGYAESLLVMLAINSLLAYAAFLPIAAGQLNLGIAGFVAIGAYCSAILTNQSNMSPALACVIAAAICGMVGVAVSLPVLRSRGIYLALATFALGQVVQGTILNLDVVGGASGYVVQQHISPATLVGLAIGAILLIVAVFHTRFSIAIAAVREDETMAEQMGQSVRLVQTLAFSAGAAAAGLAGGLTAHHYNYIEAQQFNVFLSIYVVLYVLLGGVRSLSGPLLGAAVFTLLPELLRSSAQWRYVVFATLILLVMLVRPEGLVTRRSKSPARKPEGTGVIA